MERKNVIPGLVSIIIPFYNQKKYLFHTLKSLESQTYKKIEVIIVNDGSIEDIEKEFYDFKQSTSLNITLLTQRNKGLSGARNTGLIHSKGEYIQFLDADDFIHNNKIEEQIRIFNTNDEIDIVYSGFRFLYDNQVSNTTIELFHKSIDILDDLIDRNIMIVHSALIRYKDNKLYFFDEDLKSLEDWDYWIRLAINGYKFMYDKEKFAIYRRHNSNMSNKYDNMIIAYFKLYYKHKSNNISLSKKYLYELFDRFNNSNSFISRVLFKLKLKTFKLFHLL